MARENSYRQHIVYVIQISNLPLTSRRLMSFWTSSPIQRMSLHAYKLLTSYAQLHVRSRTSRANARTCDRRQLPLLPTRKHQRRCANKQFQSWVVPQRQRSTKSEKCLHRRAHLQLERTPTWFSCTRIHPIATIANRR